MVKELISAINSNDKTKLENFIAPNIALKVPNKDSIFNLEDVITLFTSLEPIEVTNQYEFLSFTVVEFIYQDNHYISKVKIKKGLIYQIYVEEKRDDIRLFIRYSYNGTLFYGSQRQSNSPSVTGTLEEVLSQYLNHPCELIPASRTDRFVHAKDQTGHVDTTSKIPINKLKTILNHALDQDIVINSIEIVPQVFHARFDVIKKSYVYKFVHEPNPDFAHLAFYHKPFDLNTLREKMMLFKGKHDFKSFSKSESDDFTIRTIFDIEVFQESVYTCIRITGDGFLRYMIRMMIGQVLYDIDYRKNTIKSYLDNPSLEQAIHIASAKGLYLEKITYE